jgi:hypothetical protein
VKNHLSSWIAGFAAFSATLVLAADLGAPSAPRPSTAPPVSPAANQAIPQIPVVPPLIPGQSGPLPVSPGLMPRPVPGASPSPSPGSDLMNDINIQDPRAMRDPFKRAEDQYIGGVPKSPLEMAPLTTFKMTGVFTGLHHRRAIVKSDGGKVFIVSEGTKMGIRNGVITKILDDRIVVREMILDQIDEREYQNSELMLLAEVRVEPSASPSPILLPLMSSPAVSSPNPVEATPSPTGGGT